MAMSQHKAVVTFTQQVLGDKFENGRDIKSYAGKDEKRKVAELIADGMLSGEVELSAEAKAKYGDTKETLIGKYVMGMVTNWWNKSKELNGGEKYEAKNPGSRAGGQDSVIKEMRALRKHLETVGNLDGIAKVDEAIAQRLAEIAPAKPKTELNRELIPEHLRDLLG